MMNYPYLQIAGIKSEKELQDAIRLGIKNIGFPLFLDYHKEDMQVNEVEYLIKKYHNEFFPILITYIRDANKINEILKIIPFKGIQIHSDISPDEFSKINSDFKIKSLIVKEDNYFELKEIIDTFEKITNAFITDTFDNSTGAMGATGKLHNHNISKELVNYSPKPIILAGGLSPENISKAIQYVRPFGVDVHTGIEDEFGNKDILRMKKFKDKFEEAYEIIN